MKYDFDSVIERAGHDAISVDGFGKSWTPEIPYEGFDPIPMWIADMGFATVPTICKAMTDRITHPLFGYFSPRDEYFDGIIRWQNRRNGVEGLLPEHIGYENGVLGGLLSAMRAFCCPGDNILVHSPTYMGFTGSLTGAGYRICHSPLRIDGDGIWRMDFEDMERVIKENRIHAAVFCSPHNPTGRVWERWEIEGAMDIFRRNDVMVVSDEIWSDIILDESLHIPTQSVNEDARMRTVALYAPSKTFNLAGLVGSYHIVYNSTVRDRMERAAAQSHYNSMNVLSMYALIGAYTTEGEEWLEELRSVLKKNVDYACGIINGRFDGVTATIPQGTYMVFMDCSEYLRDHDMTLDELLREGWRVGVMWQDGRQHGGDRHIRLNLALPYTQVEEAFRRMEKYIFGRDTAI